MRQKPIKRLLPFFKKELDLPAGGRCKVKLQSGITFTSKKILQYAVILLGFGMNLSEIAKVGMQSLPIILSTITTSLVIAFLLQKIMKKK